ncbi:MAG: amidohydrolase family protein [Saprospiraceae bacterium]|nr:amidohydrolase family protein [Saprospiraceae bacterium]
MFSKEYDFKKLSDWSNCRACLILAIFIALPMLMRPGDHSSGRHEDLVIVGGQIIDGTRNPAYRADILISEGKIAFIGSIDTNSMPGMVIHADDKIITPGFIDSHAHGDPLTEDFENFLAMGVTTVLLGQDGSSPVNAVNYDHPKLYFDRLERARKLINLAFLSGHGTIRSRLGYTSPAPLNAHELNQLKEHTAISLESGCFGLSTGLEYLPGALAGEDELTELAQVVGNFDGIMMSHLRSEDDSLMEASLNELIRLNRYCRAHVSHIKVVFGKSAARGEEILSLLYQNNTEGTLAISADVYPYMASYTGIGIVFPPWAKTRTSFEMARLNRREELEKYLYNKIMARNGPGATLFASRPFTGKTLEEVSNESGKSFVEILMNLGPQGASGAYFVMNEALQEVFITDPRIAIASDGGPSLRHPRSYGTFAKIINKYVQKEKKLSLEQAIHKMTGLPAQIIGLEGRGTIKVGNYADLLIFDPAQVEDHATFSDPYLISTGFEYIFINGNLVRQKEKDLCLDCGSLLKKTH